jgi:hypothetical protein
VVLYFGTGIRGRPVTAFQIFWPKAITTKEMDMIFTEELVRIMRNGFVAIVFAFAMSTTAFAQASSTAQPAAAESPSAVFQTVDNHKGNRIRVAPDADWGDYAVMRFSPSVYEPVNPEHGLKPGDSLKISAEFDASLHAQFPDTGHSDGLVLEVRPIITDVKRTSTLANVVSFAAVQAIVSYGAASVRYELFDVATGRQVGEISSERNARPWNVSPLHFVQNFESLGQSSVILKSDAKNLRKDLDRLAKLGKPSGTGGAVGLE